MATAAGQVPCFPPGPEAPGGARAGAASRDLWPEPLERRRDNPVGVSCRAPLPVPTRPRSHRPVRPPRRTGAAPPATCRAPGRPRPRPPRRSLSAPGRAETLRGVTSRTPNEKAPSGGAGRWARSGQWWSWLRPRGARGVAAPPAALEERSERPGRRCPQRRGVSAGGARAASRLPFLVLLGSGLSAAARRALPCPALPRSSPHSPFLPWGLCGPAPPLPSRRALPPGLGVSPAAPCPPLFPLSFHGDAPPGARGFSMVTAAPPPRAAAPLLRPLSLPLPAAPAEPSGAPEDAGGAGGGGAEPGRVAAAAAPVTAPPCR